MLAGLALFLLSVLDHSLTQPETYPATFNQLVSRLISGKAMSAVYRGKNTDVSTCDTYIRTYVHTYIRTSMISYNC